LLVLTDVPAYRLLRRDDGLSPHHSRTARWGS
jgi:hypothetical protein